ncbi:MAG: DoxX family protein [Chitinophagaceae bacterium]|nr:DoxX family protein [Chitinophagaceae bacterium]
MIEKILHTEPGLLIFMIRIIAGIVLFPHGFQKLLGWFGGDGFSGTIKHMAHLGIPKPIAALVIVGQSFGSVALIIGFLGRIVAFFVLIIMAGAMMPNTKNGWLMNWNGKKKGEGMEYFLLYLTLVFILLVNGSGSFSLDIFLFK